MSIQQPEPVGFVVTLKDVYDQMQAGFSKVDTMRGQLTSIQSEQAAGTSHRHDLEARVRLLEGSKARVYGALALLSALFIGGGAWVGIVIGRL